MQVRQIDVAGNVGEASSLGSVTVDVSAAAPTLALESDTGTSASDHVTSDGTVVVSGLEDGASYEYSTDGGTTWVAGTGTSFTLGEGTYADVQVRQSDAAGNVSAAASLGAVTVDTSAAAPVVALASDTGTSNSDGITSDGTVTVSGLEDGATYEYSTDGGTTWIAGTGTSFELAAGTYTDVEVRQTDVAGNVSEAASLGSVTVLTPPTGDLTAVLANDTGVSASDGITSDGTVTVGGIAAGSSYEYSTDGGATWQAGTGETGTGGASFTLPEGTYSDVQVREVDAAGNPGAPTSLGGVTVDTGAPDAPQAGLVQDTGISDADQITSNGTVAVSGLEAGATYEYSTDGGTTWVAGTGTSFTLGAGTYEDVQVRQIDVAGNVGEASSWAA
ncbi:Ig-like domain-containing protein [Novosphingobium sp. 9]|uniref:Ig-like domain-containing protein n=1 Tax=Novosphingobium sp. 9 TaxID=2025349 RepID=UPI0021B56E88|nr:Ig-like domain-containing protein [Novosphingobium sp. 9]